MQSNWGSWPGRLATASLLAVLLALGFGAASIRGADGPHGHRLWLPGIELATPSSWYSVQPHIHAWSNHNASVQPGSMQLHTNWASQAGLDVIWWSDHNGVFEQYEDLTMDLQQATITNTLDILIPIPPGTPAWLREWYIGYLDATVSGTGIPAVALQPGSLQMSLIGQGQDFATLAYRALDLRKTKVNGHSFVRPLLSDPVLQIDALNCGDSSQDSYLQVKIGLSWHDYGQAAPQQLIYRLVPADQAPAVVVGPQAVTYTVPMTNSIISLPLLVHAAPLPDGDDNAIQELYLGVGARNGAQACLQINNLSIHSRRPDPDDLMAAQQLVAQRYESIYGVIGLGGWEQNSGLRHLNTYLPEDAVLLPHRGDIYVQEFVPLVHAEGGEVGLNHPFGAGYGTLLPPDQQDAQVQALLDTLLPPQAWSLDLLEIYLDRAQVDLEHHLELWDLLAANGIPMCATAASDQHGGLFTYDSTHMTTWIEARQPSQNALLEGLRLCRVFLGHIGRFDGSIDLRLGGAFMGGSRPLGQGLEPLQILIDPLPAGAQVRLVQILAQPGYDLTYLVDHLAVDPAQPAPIDTSLPGLVRAELWGADGEPLAFSNPIHLKDVACDVTGNGRVDVQDLLAVSGAFGTSPPPAALNLVPDDAIDFRDLDMAAQCWLVNGSSRQPVLAPGD